MSNDFIIILLDRLVELGVVANYRIYDDHITVIINK